MASGRSACAANADPRVAPGPSLRPARLTDPGPHRLRIGPDAPPFVLLDDARASGAVAARLFRAPVEERRIDTPDEAAALLDWLDAGRARGLHAAGYLGYAAGQGIAPDWRGAAQTGAEPGDGAPLGWFGLFDHCTRVDSDAVPALLPDPAAAWIGGVTPRLDADTYRAAVERVLALIRAGDIYQANLTFRADVALAGSPLAAYARLRAASRAGYGALVWTGQALIASLSPELFFSLRGGRVMARPMKGTAARRADPAADAAAAATLHSDAKQRAENLMIVDLLRNDLARVARPGTVKVPALFRVETYPTVHQLVSDVAADLPPGVGATAVLRAAFPCGSITGAPKSRAMEIIAQEEGDARGVYCGSIGHIAPDGEAAFNVAIRTLVMRGEPSGGLRGGAFRATLGLGSGIVADSRADDEWRECLAKGAFVTATAQAFDLIETMPFDPVEGVQRLDGHMARIGASAAALGFQFDRHGARNLLQSATFRVRHAARVRLRLSASGALAVEVSPLPHFDALPLRVAVVPRRVDADDIRLAHKTSQRALYDDARAAAGTPEILFVDDRGFLTEGSWSTLFVERDGVLLTPPQSLGLLPGVLRADLIAKGRAVESHLRLADLANGFFMGNSLRGLIPAVLAEPGAATA